MIKKIVLTRNSDGAAEIKFYNLQEIVFDEFNFDTVAEAKAFLRGFAFARQKIAGMVQMVPDNYLEKSII